MALGCNGMHFLTSDDPMELMAYRAALEHAVEVRKGLDRNLANMILEGVNKMLGG